MSWIGPIPQRVLSERRAKFRARLGEGVALVAGAHAATRSHDVEYPFRQSSDLWYLTGWEQPDALALFTRDRFVLFVQPRDPDAEIWTGRRPGTEGAVREFGADEAYPIAELPLRLTQALENVPRLFHRYGGDRELDAIVLAALEQVRAKARRGISAPEETVSPQSILHEMRLYKDEHELALMRAAAEISREGHHAAARLCREGVFEYELEAELLRIFRARGGAGPAYPPIIGAGANSTVLHYTENRAQLGRSDLVLIDAGVELHGYASDVTRTYPVGGHFSGARRDVYAAVLRSQRSALEAVRPGANLRLIHEAAVRSLVESLVELGALSGEPETLIRDETYRRYYMHSTSHFLGLDVHDVGNYHVDGKPRPLEPGMVLTVEPGLYISLRDEQAPERFRGIGVRIEDDVAVTEDGFEILTAAIPKEINDVEAWVRG